MNNRIVFFRNDIFCYLLPLLILLTYFHNFKAANYDVLAELNSTLIALASLSQVKPAISSQEPEYLSDPNFFNMLLGKTKNAKLQDKLRKYIEKLQQLSPENQKLAKYLLHFLFENESFARLYRNGGADPNYNYEVGEYYVYAAGSTDLVTRILLVINIVNDIKNNWSKETEIGIASLGAGDLLQDYILVKALYFSGYANLRLIVIDPNVNHTKDLEEIIKQDTDLRNINFKSKYYKDTGQFISNAGKNERAVNICYLVSPTNPGLSPTPKTLKVSEVLKNHRINVLRIGSQDDPSIVFYIPYNSELTFAKSFSILLIGDINQLLKKNNDLMEAFDGLQDLYPENLYNGDNILLDFYDIIKNSKLKNCIGYIAFESNITEFKDVQATPHYQLNYKSGKQGGSIWIYNPDKKRFTPV